MLAPSSLVSTFLVALSLSPQWSSANPILTADDVVVEEYHNVTLVERACQYPCGWSGQLCCESSGACYTDSSNQAQCSATAGSGGYWQYYTSTWVETDKVTRTEVHSSYIGGATVSAQATGSSIACNTDNGETSCGSICCTSQQYCQLNGQCAAIGVSESPGASPTGTGASYSAPVRPTSGTLITITATAAATTTVPFETPVATGATAPVTAGESSGGGLSGGAIAGIVIGTLAGILLLALLCLFCCAKAAFDGILAIFGFGKKKRRTEYVEEYHRHSHGSGSRHSGWYGAGDRPSRPPPPKKSGLGMGGLLAGLAGAGALFGLSKKRHESRYDDDKTTTTDYSSYYYSDYTSSSQWPLISSSVRKPDC